MGMQLVEQHVIRKTDPRYAAIDRAAFASKNLYNAANYLVRQAFIQEGVYLNYAAVFHRIKDHEAYCALPRKVSNDVLRQLDKNWRSFFAARDAWAKDPSQFVRRPSLPRYKDKQAGRNILIYDLQAISILSVRRHHSLSLRILDNPCAVREIRSMKLSDYAKQMGVRYETAWRWSRDGKIQGRRIGPHPIIITEGQEEPQSATSQHA